MNIILHPIATEKAIRMMEAENKLVFMVHRKADKAQIAAALEEMLGAKIKRVNTLNTFRGKKAVVTFTEETPAIDIATKLGLM